MKNRITLAFACLLMVTNLVAQQNDNSLLWKVEGNGIQTSYLFGTFHMLPKSDFEIKEKVKTAFEASGLVVLELDMDDPSLQSEMMKLSTIPGEETLEQHMDADEYSLLDTYFKNKMGVGMERFKKLKPFVVSSMVMMSYLGDQMASYELTLIQMAQQQQKEIKGLETVAFQMAMFDSQSYEKQMDDLMVFLEDEDTMKNFFSDMLAIYKEEDIEGLYDSMDTYFNYDKELIAAMLDDRNLNWIPKMEEYSKDQTVFYAVGSGHLGGENGVVNLLKKAGYNVTPVLD